MNRKSSPRKPPGSGSRDPAAAAGAARRGSAVPKDQLVAAKPPAAHRAPTLASLRSEIDRLDQELVHLLNRRAAIVAQIGQVKNDQGLDVWSAAREDEVIKQALACRRKPCGSSSVS
jgi:chorismate mutase/prephenate dehydratase